MCYHNDFDVAFSYAHELLRYTYHHYLCTLKCLVPIELCIHEIMGLDGERVEDESQVEACAGMMVSVLSPLISCFFVVLLTVPILEPSCQAQEMNHGKCQVSDSMLMLWLIGIQIVQHLIKPLPQRIHKTQQLLYSRQFEKTMSYPPGYRRLWKSFLFAFPTPMRMAVAAFIEGGFIGQNRILSTFPWLFDLLVPQPKWVWGWHWSEFDDVSSVSHYCFLIISCSTSSLGSTLFSHHTSGRSRCVHRL